MTEYKYNPPPHHQRKWIKISKEDIDLYANGKATPLQLAVKYGISSRNTVGQLRKAGVYKEIKWKFNLIDFDFVKESKKYVNRDRNEIIFREHLAGMPHQQIAYLHHVGFEIVRQVVIRKTKEAEARGEQTQQPKTHIQTKDKLHRETIYQHVGKFNFDAEADKEYLEQYNHLSLLMTCLPEIKDIKLEKDAIYRVTVEKCLRPPKDLKKVGRKVNPVDRLRVKELVTELLQRGPMLARELEFKVKESLGVSGWTYLQGRKMAGVKYKQCGKNTASICWLNDEDDPTKEGTK